MRDIRPHSACLHFLLPVDLLELIIQKIQYLWYSWFTLNLFHSLMHEAIQIAKTLLQLTLHSTEWKCSHICWWCIVSGWLQSDQASKARTWCLHTRGEKPSFSGRGKWVLQNAEHRTASEHSIEGPTQSLYPRMPREFQFQVSNRVSLELFTGGSVQALFIARRF